VNIKERANQASLILNNPVIKEMWETLEKDHIANWLNTADYNEQESYWHKINALRSVKEYLESLVDADKIVNKE
tara:strand:- start:1026 stop:1247 length:222 start_codon:yes stop_codon:yes gene_type:complete